MVICQTDDRVTSRPPNSNQFKQSHHSATDFSDSAASSKSCLVIPGVLRGRKGRKTKSSQESTADQSSTVDQIFNPRGNNDRKQLLVQNSNQIATDWYDGNDLEFDWESGSLEPTPVTPDSRGRGPNGGRQPASLLSFPTAKDQSHRARRNMYEKRGIKYAYDGEIEPDGARGDVAMVTPSAENKPEIPLRSFHSGSSNSAYAFQPADEDETYGEEPYEDIGLPRTFSEDISTTSSQDIQSMMKSEFGGGKQPRGLPRRVGSRRMDSVPEHDQSEEHGYTHSSQNHEVPAQIRPPKHQPAHFQPYRDSATSRSLGSSSGHSPPPNQHPTAFHPYNDISASRSVGSSSGKSQDQRIGRMSAPVSVDDSSFEEPEEHVQGIHALAMEHVQRGEYDMALQAFSQVLSVYLDKYGRAHPLTASACHNLGTVHSKRAGLLLENTSHQRHCREQALLCFQAAARSARDSPQLGPSHPNVAVSLVRIGFLLLQSRQYQNSVITFQEALRIRIDHYGPTHALVANLYNNLGVCHMHLEEFEVGRRFLQQALDIQKDLLGQDEVSKTALLELADTLCNIGGLCLEWIRQQGPDARHALDAESAFLEALEVRAKVLGENHALTNQVRSLHDMVRSIPLPEPSDKPSAAGHSMSPARYAWSQTSETNPHLSGKMSPYGTGGAGASPVPPSSVPTSPESGRNMSLEAQAFPLSQQDERLQTEKRKKDPPGLDHPNYRRLPSPPELKDQENQQAVSHRQIADEDSDHQRDTSSTGWISEAELRAHEATEESFVLNKAEDGQMSTVSYAQSTVSWSSSTQRETERLAYLMQAKAILDAHRGQSEPTPSSTANKKVASRYGDVLNHSDAMDDGLAPLGGNWPDSSSSRITPEVLKHPQRHLQMIHNSAVSFFKGGRYSEALHLLEIIVDVQRRRNGPVHEDVGAALHNVGLAELRLGQNYKALQAFEEGVRVRKQALGRDHPQVAVSLVKVGITLMLLKRLEDSLWIFREALTVRRNALGPMHPSTARILNNIGCVHVEFDEPQEAKRSFEAALDIQRSALSESPDNGPILFGAATTLQNLAYLYRKNRVYEKEALVLREACGIQEQVLGEIHPSVVSTMESLARACSLSGHKNHALKYYNECLERLYETDEDNREKQARIMFLMSGVHESLGDMQSQIEKLQLASKVLRLDKISREGADLEYQIVEKLAQARELLARKQQSDEKD